MWSYFNSNSFLSLKMIHTQNYGFSGAIYIKPVFKDRDQNLKMPIYDIINCIFDIYRWWS